MEINIWVAMIAYLLVSYIKFQTKSKLSILEFTRILRATLFQRIGLIDILSLKVVDVEKIKQDVEFAQLKFAI